MKSLLSQDQSIKTRQGIKVLHFLEYQGSVSFYIRFEGI